MLICIFMFIFMTVHIILSGFAATHHITLSQYNIIILSSSYYHSLTFKKKSLLLILTSLPLYFTSSLFSFTSTMFHTLHFIYYLHLKLFSLSFPLTLDAFFFFTVFFTSLFTHTFIHAYIHSIIPSFVFIHILIHTNYQQSVFDRCSFHFQEGSDLFIVIFWADNILTKQLTFLILREIFHLLYGPCSCCCRNFEQSSFDCDPSSFPTTPRFTSTTTP